MKINIKSIKEILIEYKDVNAANDNISIDVFCIVNNLGERISSNNSPYIEFDASDATGSIKCKSWGTTLDSLKGIKNGDIVKIRAKINYYNDILQLKLDKNNNMPYIRLLTEDDNVDTSLLCKEAPIKFEEMYNYLLDLVHSFTNEELKGICLLFLKKYEEELKYYPAAYYYHHAYKLGLLYHLYNMSKQAVEVARIYELNRDLLLSGVLLHDIGKLKTMNTTEYGVVTDFTIEGVFFEHLVQGVIMIEELAQESSISNDTKMLLMHMVSSHHNVPEWGSYKAPAFPEAIALAHIDNLDSQVIKMLDDLDCSIKEAGLTEKINGRQLYKHNLV